MYYYIQLNKNNNNNNSNHRNLYCKENKTFINIFFFFTKRMVRLEMEQSLQVICKDIEIFTNY